MSARPTHRQLEYLVAVSETGHFRAAADRCNVSQPTLSTQIQLLEDRLGAKLIDRAPGGARPTPLGEVVINLSRSVLVTLDEIQNVAMSVEANLGGLIRLGVVPTFGPYFLPRVLPRLHSQYPELELYVREERPLELERSLADGTLDCALTRPPDAESRLIFHALTEENLRLGIPAGHPLAHKKSIQPAMLKGLRMLTLGPDYSLNQGVQSLCRSTGAIINDDYEGTSLDAVRQMVSIGMGLSLFPDLYVESEFQKEERVILRDIEGIQLKRSIGLVWRSGSVRSQQYLRLLEECRKMVNIE